MSGMFWQSDNRPNICEAATGFTLSSIDLLVAIPLFLVDISVNTLSSLLSLVMFVCGPVMEYVQIGLSLLAETLGIQETPSNLELMLGVACVMVCYNSWKEWGPKTAGGSWRQFVFVLTDLAMGVGYVRVICDLPQPEAALYPGLLTLFVCIISGANAVDIFFRDYNCYRSEAPSSELESAGQLFVKICKSQAVAVLSVAAFGYPTFTAEDDIKQYLCLVPVFAWCMFYGRINRPGKVVAQVNGSAVIPKETTEVKAAEAAADPVETVAAPVEDIAMAEETKPAAEEVDAKVEEKTEAQEEANNEAAKPEAAAEEEVSKADLKVSAAINRVVACLTGLIGAIASLCAPVTACAAAAAARLTGLPWACLATAGLTHGTTLLAACAWYALTANQLAAVLLAVFSLVLPAGLARFGPGRLSAGTAAWAADCVHLGEKALVLTLLSNSSILNETVFEDTADSSGFF